MTSLLLTLSTGKYSGVMSLLHSTSLSSSATRESVAQLIDAGRKVVDSPVHLADFGKSVVHGTSCDHHMTLT